MSALIANSGAISPVPLSVEAASSAKSPPVTKREGHVLVSHHLCPYVQRAVIVLVEKSISFERVDIDLKAKPDWFLAISPLGRTPVLKTGDRALFESQVIAEYLDEITPGSLHPRDPLEKARHRSWIEFGSETLNAIARFYNAPDGDVFEERRRALREKIVRISREIAGPWFDGEEFHMIDGVWGTIFRYLDVFDTIGDFGLMSDLPDALSWRGRIATRASVRSAGPADYADRLRRFLAARNSHISTLINS